MEDLPQLGILVGPNGSGKSTLLEALLIGSHGDPGDAIGRAVRSRPTPRGAPWLFDKRGEAKLATIIASSDSGMRMTSLEHSPGEGVEDTIRWQVQPIKGEVLFSAGNSYQRTSTVRPSPLAHVRWLAPFADAQVPLHEIYTEVVTQGRRPAAKSIIKAVVPGFEDIEILVEGGQPVVHIVFADHSVPVSLMGSGTSALVRLALELAARPGGTVLLEEPEVHQHPAAMRQSARAILAAARRNIQVLFSTHSLDFIDALMAEATAAERKHLAVYRLSRAAGSLQATRISGDDVLQARATIGDDLR